MIEVTGCVFFATANPPQFFCSSVFLKPFSCITEFVSHTSCIRKKMDIAMSDWITLTQRHAGRKSLLTQINSIECPGFARIFLFNFNPDYDMNPALVILFEKLCFHNWQLSIKYLWQMFCWITILPDYMKWYILFAMICCNTNKPSEETIPLLQ